MRHGDRRVNGKWVAATRLARGRPRHNSTNRSHGMDAGECTGAVGRAPSHMERGEQRTTKERGRVRRGGGDSAHPRREGEKWARRAGASPRREGAAATARSVRLRGSEHFAAAAVVGAHVCRELLVELRERLLATGRCLERRRSRPRLRCVALRHAGSSRPTFGQPSASPRPTLANPRRLIATLSATLSATLARLVVRERGRRHQRLDELLLAHAPIHSRGCE